MAVHWPICSRSAENTLQRSPVHSTHGEGGSWKEGNFYPISSQMGQEKNHNWIQHFFFSSQFPSFSFFHSTKHTQYLFISNFFPFNFFPPKFYSSKHGVRFRIVTHKKKNLILSFIFSSCEVSIIISLLTTKSNTFHH